MSGTTLQLSNLRRSLLRNCPEALRSDQGDRALLEHKLLATQVHRASRLAKRRSKEGEGEAWVYYVTTFFPSGHSGAGDARLLWKEWRTHLLKEDCPGPFVPVTHGQPHAHWTRDPAGQLCVDLESMWDDFAASVEGFVSYLEQNDEPRRVALKRLRESQWAVQPLSTLNLPVSGATAMAIPLGSATVGPPKQ